jgi:group II intron reverse transcriptase/maturase
MGFTSLAYLMDIEWLTAAFHRTRKDGAPGVDGQTWSEYAANLEANLQSLLDRAKAGTYRAPPVRRVHIPKAGSATETRPIGIPTLEDKVLQRAVVMLLEPIYEQDFYAGSYGFRPGRSAHQALQDLWRQTMNVGGGWILEVDIRKFFDTLDHAHLREFLRRRMVDGVLNRLIGKWLNAGVLEDGSVSYPEAGSPQGGVISPLLANIFLHYVLDEWFAQEVQPRLQGQAHLIRYADDFVILFAHEADSRRVLEVLSKRFEKYGLTLHPDKTRLIPFRRPRREASDEGNDEGPGTFDLLGFTHYWGKSRKGSWMVMRKTSSSRLSRAVRSIAQWCRDYRHWPIREQYAKLRQKIRGHYAYYGITNNARSLRSFLEAVQRAWRKWLDRRNNRREMVWSRFAALLKRYPLPLPRIVHSYLHQRTQVLRSRMV